MPVFAALGVSIAAYTGPGEARPPKTSSDPVVIHWTIVAPPENRSLDQLNHHSEESQSQARIRRDLENAVLRQKAERR